MVGLFRLDHALFKVVRGRAGVVEHLFGVRPRRNFSAASIDPLSNSARGLYGPRTRPDMPCRAEGEHEGRRASGERVQTREPRGSAGPRSPALLTVIDKRGQALKGVWWMSWHREATKDVVACDMPREAGKRALIRGFPNRETGLG